MPPEKRKKAVDELVEKGELPRAKKGPNPARKPKEVARVWSPGRGRGGGPYEVGAPAMAKLLGMELVKEGEEK